MTGPPADRPAAGADRAVRPAAHDDRAVRPVADADRAARAGGPAVLLCPGMGEGASTWDRLAPLLTAAGYRVRRLDRPDDGAAPTLTAELGRIDAAVAGLDRPVLVAHSAAALPAEAYARRHPGRLAGLVLVDPSLVDPGGAARWAWWSAWSAGAVTALAPVLAGGLDRSGLARRCGPWAWRRAVRRMSVRPPDPAAAVPWGSGAVLVGALTQWLGHPAVAAELSALRAVTPAPVLPVRVLTALGDVATPAGRAAWRAGHARLAAGFPAGRQEVFRDARHLVHVDRPAVVADAVAAVRRDSGS
ncbi:alpha/beta hydrolase [Micromonospora sp. WMMD987]|uniref:alpha/beta fold hydrolase n=1 Tax=Micromonospora TaxID=1873 RepID=UPI00249BF266|nr:alpha/beta hydrolase [Micromonospora sp. WMMD987]WFE94545.1 alpha/beta hydrolase [Micromonospora sp. WMMD987]